MIDTKVRGHSTVPVILKGILTDALALRDRRDNGEVGPAEFQAAVAGLDARVESLPARRAHTEENRRLLKHLRNEADALFSFLRHEGVDATNYRAEQGIRPGVVNRKVWGGSRTNAGARTHERLVSLLRTAAQQGGDAMAILVELIRRCRWWHPLLFQPPGLREPGSISGWLTLTNYVLTSPQPPLRQGAGCRDAQFDQPANR